MCIYLLFDELILSLSIIHFLLALLPLFLQGFFEFLILLIELFILPFVLSFP